METIKKTPKKVTKLFKEPGEEKVTWFKISKRVSLPVNTGKVDDAFIPKNIPFEDNKKTLEEVAIAVAKQIPVLLIGETGTGKTSLVRHLAHETKNAFVRVNHNGGTTTEDILGRWTIGQNGQTIWIDGILVEAMKKGYWFLADEINAASAEINFAYHSLLDDDGYVMLAEKGNEVVVPHPNFRFFGAMNPPTEYAGTKELNKALMSRFIVSKVDFPSPKVEEKILVARTGIDADVAEKMIRCAFEIRASHAKQNIRFVFSTRDLIMWATMFKVYKKYLPAAENTVLNKVGEDDYESIKDVMSLHFKSLDQGQSSSTTAATGVDEEEGNMPF